MLGCGRRVRRVSRRTSSACKVLAGGNSWFGNKWLNNNIALLLQVIFGGGVFFQVQLLVSRMRVMTESFNIQISIILWLFLTHANNPHLLNLGFGSCLYTKYCYSLEQLALFMNQHGVKGWEHPKNAGLNVAQCEVLLISFVESVRDQRSMLHVLELINFC